MSTHSSPPLSVEQNVLLPNSPIPSTRATSVTTRSRVSKLRLEVESRLDRMQKQQIDAFEHLEQQRRLERKQNQSMFKLLLDKLNITDITFKSDYINQNEKQYDLTMNSITLHDTNTLPRASVVNTPAAISEPANTSDKYVSTPISLISIIPSSEDQPLMPKAPQLVADMPVAATATKVDARVPAEAHVELEFAAKTSLVTSSPAQPLLTLYDGCMAELTYCKVSTSPRPPLLAHLTITAHHFLHHPSYIQLVNLIPFDPGGM